ncbi:MAG: glycerol-3-phosphate dehydrogenase [Ruminococcaceae bacterium]|nr:glycerol-3-phosphate dehydrogenase [Oscillospiraceae bacterium]
MAVITIIGSGMMGSALAFPARDNGNEVRIVGTHLDRQIIEACKKTNRHPKFTRDFPDGIAFYQFEELSQALPDTDVVIGGVSSFGVDWFADEILPVLPDGMKLLTVTKGLLDTPDGRLMTYPHYWEQRAAALGKHFSFNAIGGPCTSYELVFGDQTEVAFCGRNREDLLYLRSLMNTDYYHITVTDDIVGIESAVALKNGYALGIALTIGLNQRQFGLDSELHFNSQAAVFGQSVKEMARLLEFQGAMNMDNLAVGAGDLYVTVYGGRTRLIGILLGRGMDIEEAKKELNGVTLESLVVAERVGRVIRHHIGKGTLKAEDFPLLLHIDDIITRQLPVNIPWESFKGEYFQ